LNEAFVIDAATRERLISEDPRSDEIIKPFLEGKDLKKWRLEPQNKYLLHIPSGSTLRGGTEAQAWNLFQNKQPAIARWLKNFETAARKRSDKGEFWWELRACAYYDKFETSKIIYPHFSPAALFLFEEKNYFSNDKCYIIPSNEIYLSAFFNSKVIWFLLCGMSPAVRGGFYELRAQYVQTLPIPPANETQKSQLAKLAKTAQTAAEQRFIEIRKFNHAAVRDFAPTGKLPAAWSDALPSFSGFTAELKKRFKRDLNLQERNDWDNYLTTTQTRINELTQTITRAEREINALVCELFGLTADEVGLLG
jgi:hypothetical protein